MSEKTYVTTQEAAAMTGLSVLDVRRLIRMRELTAKREGNKFLIDADSLKACMEKQGNNGEVSEAPTAIVVNAEGDSNNSEPRVKSTPAAVLLEQQKKALDAFNSSINEHERREQEFSRQLRFHVDEMQKILAFSWDKEQRLHSGLQDLLRQFNRPYQERFDGYWERRHWKKWIGLGVLVVIGLLGVIL